MIVIVAVLVLTASIFESLRFFYPPSLHADEPLKSQPLPDGTAVTLDPAATLLLGNEWHHGGLREVWLQGSAWFAVPRQQDTSKLTIHLSAFDVVVQHATLYGSNQKEESYVQLKQGNAYILTHESKPKKLIFEPGTIIKQSGRRLYTAPAVSDTTHPVTLPVN